MFRATVAPRASHTMRLPPFNKLAMLTVAVGLTFVFVIWLRSAGDTLSPTDWKNSLDVSSNTALHQPSQHENSDLASSRTWTGSDRAPFYSRDEIFYKLDGGCTDEKGWFWAESFFLAIDGFRQHPHGTYWDTMWVCNQRGFSIPNWGELDGRTINMYPNVFSITNDKQNFCRHMRKYWGYQTDEEFAKNYLPCYNNPKDSAELAEELKKRPSSAWVQKPAASSGGQGVQVVATEKVKVDQPGYVQYYVKNPLLINKRKFDLRLFVLVPSVDPLVVYVHSNDMVRHSMVDYDPDPAKFDDKTMHITNVHFQKVLKGYKKQISRYERDTNPWTLPRMMEFFEEHSNEYNGISTKQIWLSIKAAVVDAFLALQEPLAATPCDGCYQIFGVDLLLDENFKAYIIEMNTTPGIERDVPHAAGNMLLPVYAEALRMKNIQVRMPKIDTKRVRDAVNSMPDGGDLDETNFKLLCSHIHMFYYREGFDLAWPRLANFEELENSHYTHTVYTHFRQFLSSYRDLSQFFSGKPPDFFEYP